jgi:type I restriction enzyme M protein
MTEDKLSQQKLESYLWGCAEYLRNKIDAGDYKVYIFPMLFYKRVSDVYDEEYESLLAKTNDEKYASNPINHLFVIPDGSHWNDLRKVTKDVGIKIQKSMQEIGKANPDTLYDIFGDANWGYKERLSDEVLIDLIEHFSTEKLSLERVHNDQMGNGYEYLIKKFADDSGHTAAEFYTNRTVVSLMTELLKPKQNDSIYDPTCGTGGMLLESINYLKRNKKDHRTISLFGQEKNVISSAIARMNTLLHGYTDAKIKQGDTLEEPAFLVEDELQKFDVILANPPYSINKWNRKKFESDPYNRNIYGCPTKGIADYAFIQHIICSLTDSGRTAILLPHGVLFRDSEINIRKELLEDDKLETVIGLPKDMFYNSTMESCIMIFKTKKDKNYKNKIKFISALEEFERKDKKNFFNQKHIEKITNAYDASTNIENVSYIAEKNEIIKKGYSFNISLYIQSFSSESYLLPDNAVQKWHMDSKSFSNHLKILLDGI